MPGDLSLAESRRDVATRIVLWLAPLLTVMLPFAMYLGQLADALRQDQINRTYLPVEATVIASRVTSFTGSKGAIHYVPKVEYQFEVRNKAYQSNRIFPLSAWGSEAWAMGIANRFKADHTCSAYYNPQNPSQSVLIRRYDFSPYGMMLGMAFATAGGSFLTLMMWLGQRRKPVPANEGGFELKPILGERQRLFIAKVCTSVWYSLGGVTAAHYFLKMPAPHGSGSLTTFAIFAAAGLVPAAFLLRYTFVCRTLSDARLVVDCSAAILGRPFKFKLSQNASRPLPLKRVRLHLRCIALKVRGRSRQTTVLYEETAFELNSHTLHSGETLEASGELTCPPTQPPTGRDISRKYTRFDWEIRLECKAGRSLTYRATFPLIVQSALARDAD